MKGRGLILKMNEDQRNALLGQYPYGARQTCYAKVNCYPVFERFNGDPRRVCNSCPRKSCHDENKDVASIMFQNWKKEMKRATREI